MTTTEPIKGSPESSLNFDVDPTAFENTHVHQVYESIASHFSSTRYKPWPVVDRFLRSRKPGEVGLDVGCGNGKYLGVNPDVFIIGSDRSPSLIAIAAQLHHSHPTPDHDKLRENQHGHQIRLWNKPFGASTDKHRDPGRSKPISSSASVSTLTTKTSNSTTSSTSILPAKTPAGTGTGTAAPSLPESLASHPASKSTSTLLVADTLSLPHPANAFDFAICIAVIHHLATRERRVNAISEILRVLKRADAGSGGSTIRSYGGEGPSTTTTTTNTTSVEGGRGPGQALLFVWALEQKSSRRGWDTGMQKDRFVPWVLNDGHRKVNQNGNGTGTGTGNVNRNANVKPETDPESESEEQSQTANLQGQDVAKSADGGSSSVENPEPGPEPHPQPQPQIRTQTEKSQTTNPSPTHSDAKTTFHRFYHLYSTHELDAEVADAGGRVVQRGYDRDNWWVVVEPAGLR